MICITIKMRGDKMDETDIVAVCVGLFLIALLTPIGIDAFADARDMSTNESEQLDYYNSLSDADKANYTSDYAEDGEAPTPWSTAETAIFGIFGIIIIIAVVRGMMD